MGFRAAAPCSLLKVFGFFFPSVMWCDDNDVVRYDFQKRWVVWECLQGVGGLAALPGGCHPNKPACVQSHITWVKIMLLHIKQGPPSHQAVAQFCMDGCPPSYKWQKHASCDLQNPYKDLFLLMNVPGSKNIQGLWLLADSESAGSLRTGMVTRSPLGWPDVFWVTLESCIQPLAYARESCLCLQVNSVLS